MSLLDAPRTGARLPQALFGLALALLVLLTAWWFWFLAGSVAREDIAWYEKTALQAQLAALDLAATGQIRPGPVASDDRLIVASAEGRLGARIPGSALEVRVKPQVIAAHARDITRRKAMIYGEGSLLILLVCTCIVMLYRLVLAEQRYRRDIESFLSRVTHEMKTPLAGLKALLQTLRAGRVPDERLRELAEMGMRQAEREEHLIENLLLAHRLATTREALVTTDLDVRRLLADFAAHRVATMGESEGRLSVNCEEGLTAHAHAGAVGTILENLADNAFKYGATGLDIGARQDGARLIISVADDGMGFEPTRAEALFRPFQRETSAAGRHGTGLGLPIARELARELGGDLRAESGGAGCGARFTLVLPAAAGRPAGSTAATSTAATRGRR